MTHSPNSGRSELKRFAGLTAAVLIGVFLLTTVLVVNTKPAHAASSPCADPAQLIKLAEMFPDNTAYDGPRKDRLLASIEAGHGLPQGFDAAAVTDLFTRTSEQGTFVWLVEDGQQACYAISFSNDKWDELLKSALGLGV